MYYNLTLVIRTRWPKLLATYISFTCVLQFTRECFFFDSAVEMKEVFLLLLMWWFLPNRVSSDILRSNCLHVRVADFKQPHTSKSRVHAPQLFLLALYRQTCHKSSSLSETGRRATTINQNQRKGKIILERAFRKSIYRTLSRSDVPLSTLQPQHTCTIGTLHAYNEQKFWNRALL